MQFASKTNYFHGCQPWIYVNRNAKFEQVEFPNLCASMESPSTPTLNLNKQSKRAAPFFPYLLYLAVVFFQPSPQITNGRILQEQTAPGRCNTQFLSELLRDN